MRKIKGHAGKTGAKGHIRIIAGQHRGRKLPVLMSEGLRPTTDRVKETLFNWLMPYIQHTQCLDCFAGSGSLGFEALSRGADMVTLVELHKAVAKQLQANKRLLKADNVEIIQNNVLMFLKESKRQYSLVFIDPPFRQGLVEPVVSLLAKKCLTNNALIYIEMAIDDCQQGIPKHWQLLKEKKAGQVRYCLYQNSAAYF